jgi:hypothetical protein
MGSRRGRSRGMGMGVVLVRRGDSMGWFGVR